jgi:ABC-2 type transport system ATP-binding protein
LPVHAASRKLRSVSPHPRGEDGPRLTDGEVTVAAALLRVEHLSKRYGSTLALDGVDLSIDPGEVLGLLGPNGAGKTTLASVVAGLLRPDAGRVWIAGIDAHRDRHRTRALVGYAPQDLGIYPSVTVCDNLRVFAGLAGLARRDADARIDWVADALGLTPLLDRRARFLSGGEKRRLHTALALLHTPPLLLLDEPTVGVDVHTRAALLRLVRRLAADGAAVCYSTHYLHEVEEMAGSVAILERGRLVARDTVAALVARHGQAAIEMRFSGPVPPTLPRPYLPVGPGAVRIRTERPAWHLAEAVRALGGDAASLLGVEIVHPDLQSVYFGLTGRAHAQTR